MLQNQWIENESIQFVLNKWTARKVPCSLDIEQMVKMMMQLKHDTIIHPDSDQIISIASITGLARFLLDRIQGW